MEAKESSHEKFINTLFDDNDVICIRPIETWIEDGKKQSRVDYESIEYLKPKALFRRWGSIVHYTQRSKCNLFFGVCPRCGGSGQETYDAAWQIRRVNALWSDIDDCDAEESVARCERAGLPKPSIVVSSGHGAHLYWLLDEPFLIDDADKPPPIRRLVRKIGERNVSIPFYQNGAGNLYLRNPDTGRAVRENVPDLTEKAMLIQDIVAGIAISIGGDHTIDLSRILRLPDTLNRKGERNGQHPIMSRVLHLDETCRYSIDTFRSFAEESPDKKKREVVSQIPLPAYRARQTQSNKDRLTQLITDCAVAPVGTRSEADYAMIAFAIENGMSQDNVWSQACGVGKFAEDERFGSGRAYFDHTWEKVARSVREKIFDRTINRRRAEQEHEDGEESSEKERDALHKKICADLKIDVLGEYADNHRAVVFSHHYGKFVEVPRSKPMTYPEMLQSFGSPAEDKVAQTAEAAQGGMYTMAVVQNAIALLAGQRRVPSNQGMKGPGCWPSVDDEGHDSGKCVLVGAGEASRWDGKILEKFRSPRDGAQLINISESDPWFDGERLSGLLKEYTPEWGIKVLNEAAEIFDRWNWEHQVHTPKILAALIAASWVQTLWKMRPQVGIFGKTNAGKSYLLETVASLFGPLAEPMDKPTEPGLRQKIGDTAKIPLVDEFERSKHRKMILEAIRTSSRGGTIVRGTGISQRAREFHLRHMFWLFSTELGLRDAPDRNRFILMSLRPAAKGEYGRLKRPEDPLCRRLGHELLAVAIWSVMRARELAVELKGDVTGVDNRIVESFAVPTAMWSVATGCEDEAPLLLDTWLRTVDRSRGGTISDEEELLRTILASTVRLSPSLDLSVAEIISGDVSEDHNYLDHLEVLERHGVAIIASKGGNRRYVLTKEPHHKRLFLHLEQIERKLLGIDWRGKDLSQILCQLPNSRTGQRMIASQKVNGIILHFDFVKENFLDDPDFAQENFSGDEEEKKQVDFGF